MTRIPMAIHKDLRPLVEAALEAGCELSTSGRHPRLLLPDGSFVVFAGTPTRAHRARRNLRRDLRQRGIVL